MTNRTALIALRDAVVAGEFDLARLDGVPGIWRFNAFMDLAEPAFESIPELLRTRQNCPISWEAYEGSFDAAIALLEAVLPGWGWHVRKDPDGRCYGYCLYPRASRVSPGGSEAKDPARALLIATLNALIAETD